MATAQQRPRDRAKLELITQDIIYDLRLQREMRQLKEEIDSWIEECSPEMQDKLRWQFGAGSKYFRPLTVFCCHRAVSGKEIPPEMVRTAMVLEMFHNVSLIIDDIVDQSDERREKQTLHRKFELLPALMVAGYMVADGFDLLSRRNTRDADCIRHDIGLFAELLKRLGVAECMQWKLRRQPLGVEDWRRIAREDTGSMFEVCACLGTGSDRLRVFGRLLGMLYHGCDDVGDLNGLTALGKKDRNEDLEDGILTLPAALAIRDDARIRKLFCKPGPRSPKELEQLKEAFSKSSTLKGAQEELDGLELEAIKEAELSCAGGVGVLTKLVKHTRELANR